MVVCISWLHSSTNPSSTVVKSIEVFYGVESVVRGTTLTHYSTELLTTGTDYDPLLLLLALAGDVQPNPGPSRDPCSVCFKNVTSQGTSYLCTRCSHWVHSKSPNIQNYTLVRQDRRQGPGGGLLFFIHTSVSFIRKPLSTTSKNDPHLEELTISITMDNTELLITNVYIPRPVPAMGVIQHQSTTC